MRRNVSGPSVPLHRRMMECAIARTGRTIVGQADSRTVQTSLIHYFYPERIVDAGNVVAAAQVKSHMEARVGGLLDQMDTELAAHGQPWLLGTHFSAVDLYALMLCRWTRGFTRPARSLPNLGPYLQRVLARPAVQRVFTKEGLAAPMV